jgi:hypothetical protein
MEELTALGQEQLSPGFVIQLLIIAVLAITTLYLSLAKAKSRSPIYGGAAGMIAGFVTAVFLMILVAPALELPWFVPINMFGTAVFREINIIDFNLLAFLTGLGLMLLFTSLSGALFALILRQKTTGRIILSGFFYGLTLWAVFQYLLSPLFFRFLVFRSFWYIVSFMIYGLFLSGLISFVPRWRKP